MYVRLTTLRDAGLPKYLNHLFPNSFTLSTCNVDCSMYGMYVVVSVLDYIILQYVVKVKVVVVNREHVWRNFRGVI